MTVFTKRLGLIGRAGLYISHISFYMGIFDAYVNSEPKKNLGESIRQRLKKLSEDRERPFAVHFASATAVAIARGSTS